MSHELKGSVYVKETGLPVIGAWVRLVIGDKSSPEVVRTGEDATFSLAYDGQGGLIDVTDRAGKVLATMPLGSSGPWETRIEVSQDVLAASAVRNAENVPVLRAEVLKTIALGIEQLEDSVLANAALALESLTCRLPPIATLPDLFHLAQDVLEARAGAATRFREHLRHFEAWNAARYPTRTPPPAQELEALFIKLAHGKHPPHERRIDRNRLVEAKVVVTMVAAAALVSGNDLTRLWRALQAVHGQLQAIAQLRPLLRDARAASFGVPGAARLFQLTLGEFGGFCMPGFHPFPSPFPEGNPIPYPDPGDWHDPIEVPVDDWCPEAIPDIAVAVAERMSAAEVVIERVEPSDACPGETLTLYGTGLSPGGFDPMVGFAVEGSPSRRFVTASAFSDTHIDVLVPYDAICGELELLVPAAEPVNVCGVDLDFNVRPAHPPIFLGGRTKIWAFTHRPAKCLHSGEEVELAWEVCNARAVDLSVEITERPPGASDPVLRRRVALTLDPRAGSEVLRIPDLVGDGSLHATLVARSRCGQDERELRVGIQRQPSDGFVPLGIVSPYENWHGNVTRRVTSTVRPTTLSGLVDAVRTAERMNMGRGVRVGVEGTRWSYTECTVPQASTPLIPPLVIDTSGLNNIRSDVLGAARLDTLESVLPDWPRQRIDRMVATANGLDPDTAPPLPIWTRLVHVEAGIKLWDLNCKLDPPPFPGAPFITLPLAIPNLGGSRGQSLAGAINTGTHGATVDLPPIPDLVRALHLVANGGQQWWIERRNKPVTNEAAMRDLMARGVLDPCLELRYDDHLFNACLVAMGQAGIVYSMIIEAVPLHMLQEETRTMSWEAVKAEIRTEILENTGILPWYYEVSVNPSIGRPAWVTTRTPTSAPIRERARPSGSAGTLTEALWTTLFGTAAFLGPAGLIGLGSGALAFVMNGLGFHFLERSRAITEIILTGQLWRIGELLELEEDIDAIGRLTGSVDDIVAAISASASGDGAAVDEALANALPDLLSALWRIGIYFISGRQILDAVQNLFTNITQRPPGTEVGKSYTILTEQPNCGAAGGAKQEHTALERLIHSQEYAVPAEQLVPFAEAILDEADAVRNEEDHALILILNLRFVRPTVALMGMQQFDLTGLVEVWTISRMAGNASFHARVNRVVNEFMALPHWGHVHEVRDLSERFGPNASEWKRLLNTIALTAGHPNTFRHQFALDRGLLEDL
ncbi:D-arabinono-1,4-lactone oxidase [Variovorax sp. J22R133]|uniref:D-arabinono-1,4-lactone oxidase n=1 Tax=Variovorax brevis TaxID=3053503 RepID=UPI00257771CD|nr:D-arabinono-1,4-lactone oxidase [Variovorax sp. J22R133]MDM0116733.1 D-arabinono-1,4-lactone oxidase [Variovorax sp. J22R133]